MATRIIDLSKFNVVTDWNSVKKSCEGIILRVAFRGYGSGKITADTKFAEFATKCNEYNIPWGIYFMSSAISNSEAEDEAVYSVQKAINYGMPRYMPIFIDSEDVDGTSAVRRSDGLSKSARTSVLNAFIRQVKQLGFKSGLYCSDSWTRDSLNWDEIKHSGINWIAKYGRNDGKTVASVQASPCHIHQFTSKAFVPGINGNCDLSYCYIDLFEEIETKVSRIATPTIKMAYSGPNVQKLQQNINEVTGWNIPESGSADSLTISALMIWQHLNGLDSDGIYGKKSYAKMEELISKS